MGNIKIVNKSEKIFLLFVGICGKTKSKEKQTDMQVEF